MVNKFLHPAGGAETYTFKVGEYLKRQGCQVEYFGMDHKENVVGNRNSVSEFSHTFVPSAKLY